MATIAAKPVSPCGQELRFARLFAHSWGTSRERNRQPCDGQVPLRNTT